MSRCVCGHSWSWHHNVYDDESGRFVGHPCEHWLGCCCKFYVEEGR